MLNQWQGSETDKEEIAKISEAIKKEEDLSVCLLNYKKSGESFVNQFFICPVYTSDKKLAYYLGMYLLFISHLYWFRDNIMLLQ